jgi:Mrp family chromosome partitioning ATPase
MRVANAPQQDSDPHDPNAKSPGTQLFGKITSDGRSKLHLMLITGPMRNPHEALASPHLPLAIANLRSVYDLVILDTPPLLAVSDAVKLAQLSDDVVMVVSWRKATRDAVAAALKTLDRSGAQVSGVVLSKVDLRKYARGGAGDAHLAKAYGGYHPNAARLGY